MITIERWESSRENGKKIPKFKELKMFLMNWSIALDSTNSVTWSSKFSPACDAKNKQRTSLGGFG